jgi:hypothetical protein
MNEKKTKTKRKLKISLGGYVLILSVVVSMIAVGYFGWTLFEVWNRTGTITVGNRFLLQLDPPITTEQLTTLRTQLTDTNHVEESSVNLNSATLRITVLINPDLSVEELQATMLSLKDLVNATLPISTYFADTDSHKMYDLEIHVYNDKDHTDTETFDYHYFVLIKNGTMNAWLVQELSAPVNPELAQKLRDSLNPEEATE